MVLSKTDTNAPVHIIIATALWALDNRKSLTVMKVHTIINTALLGNRNSLTLKKHLRDRLQKRKRQQPGGLGYLELRHALTGCLQFFLRHRLGPLR